MEGVTILNTITQEIHAGSFLGFGCISGILLVMAGLFLLISSCILKEGRSVGVGLIAVLVGIVAIIIAYPDYGPIIEYKYSYEVYINDDVNFKEFNEKYEVVDQRGDIYTIIEREPD